MKKEKTLLIVADSAGKGGSGESMLALIKGISHNYNIIVILPGHGVLKQKLKKANVNIFIVNDASWRFWVNSSISAIKFFLTIPLTILNLYQYCKLLQQFRLDIIHINSHRLITPLIAAKILRKKCLIHFRDIPSKIRYKFIFGEKIYYRIASRANCWVAISNSVRDDLKRSSTFNKVKLIHNGIDIKEFDKKKALKNEFIFNNENYRVAMVAGINIWKSQMDFVKAAISILRKRMDCTFYIVGWIVQKDYYNELQNIINKAGFSEKIIFTNYINNIPSFLSEVNLLVHTTHHEPFGRVFIDAMAAKLPIISYNSGGARDIIIDGFNGRLVETGNWEKIGSEIIKLIENQNLGIQYGINGRDRVEKNFNIEKHCKNMEKLYTKILYN